MINDHARHRYHKATTARRTAITTALAPWRLPAARLLRKLVHRVRLAPYRLYAPPYGYHWVRVVRRR
jgi:hypothetical protein